MILIIDNYDSFTYNLFHYISVCSKDEIRVIRNDKISVDQIRKLAPKAIVISPGPCTPNEAGICLDLVSELKSQIPILGVCLGHQIIGQVFGGKIIRTKPMHGKISKIIHQGSDIFNDIPSPFNATRYHSLIIENESCPTCLEVTARTEDGIIMAVKHKEYKISGVQFHPESISSEYGHKMIENFLQINGLN